MRHHTYLGEPLLRCQVSLFAAINSTTRTVSQGRILAEGFLSHIMHLFIKFCRFWVFTLMEAIIFPRKLIQFQRKRCFRKQMGSRIIYQPAIELELFSILRIQHVRTTDLCNPNSKPQAPVCPGHIQRRHFNPPSVILFRGLREEIWRIIIPTP